MYLCFIVFVMFVDDVNLGFCPYLVGDLGVTNRFRPIFDPPMHSMINWNRMSLSHHRVSLLWWDYVVRSVKMESRAL